MKMVIFIRLFTLKQVIIVVLVSYLDKHIYDILVILL